MLQPVDYCVRDLGHALGLGDNLALANGVAAIQDAEGSLWILQAPPDGTLLILCSPLATLIDAGQERLESWLRLNSRFDILHGAWIGLDAQGWELCLLASIPLSVLTSQLLYNLFINLYNVRADLAAREAAGELPPVGSPAAHPRREPTTRTHPGNERGVTHRQLFHGAGGEPGGGAVAPPAR